jgi:hypothetical protein
MSAAARNAQVIHALREVVTWGRLMRERQGVYFKTRTQDALKAAFAAERSFDAALAHALSILEEPADVS